MKQRILLVGATVLATVWGGAAFAGQINYSNAKGVWQSTQCTLPAPPASTSASGDNAADSLNGNMAQRQLYVDQMNAYMRCVSEEAGRDARLAGELIVKSAEAILAEAEHVANDPAGSRPAPTPAAAPMSPAKSVDPAPVPAASPTPAPASAPAALSIPPAPPATKPAAALPAPTIIDPSIPAAKPEATKPAPRKTGGYFLP
jgi:hypothetical protein